MVINWIFKTSNIQISYCKMGSKVKVQIITILYTKSVPVPVWPVPLTSSTMTLSGVLPENTKPRFCAALTRAPSSGKQKETSKLTNIVQLVIIIHLCSEVAPVTENLNVDAAGWENATRLCFTVHLSTLYWKNPLHLRPKIHKTQIVLGHSSLWGIIARFCVHPEYAYGFQYKMYNVFQNIKHVWKMLADIILIGWNFDRLHNL